MCIIKKIIIITDEDWPDFFSIAAAIIGDFSGKYLAEYQPEKIGGS